MILRPLLAADAVELLVVWNRAARYDVLTADLLAEKIWHDADYRPELAWAAEINGQVAGMAVGLVRTDAAPEVGFIKLLAVAPGFERQGIGSKLLARVEEQLARQGAKEIRIAESAPNYLTPGVDERYEPAKEFFMHHDYEHFKTSYNLSVDLVAQEFAIEPLLAHHATLGVEIRRAANEDQPALAAFLNVHWPTWNAEVRQTFCNTPISLHLAWRGGEVIGFAAYDSNNLDTGWFGPMGTDPTCRKTGIGKVLLHCCLRDLQLQGLETATIAWAAHIDFYKHHAGAVVSRVFWRYRKMLL